MRYYVVLRLYVNNDGSYSHCIADSVSDTREQAIGSACSIASRILANTKNGTLKRSDDCFSVFSEGGEVRMVVQRCDRLDSSNYKFDKSVQSSDD